MDLFKERETLKKKILEYLNNEKNMTVAIDGLWGSGKSYLLDVIQEECNDKNNMVFLKIDTWKYQNYPNLNLALLEVFYDQLTTNEKIKSELPSNLAEKITKVISKVHPVAEAIIDVCVKDGNLTNNQYYNIIDEKNFYDILIDMLSFIKDKKIIIAFDELDRVNPDMAIVMLNKIVYLSHLLKDDKTIKANIIVSFNKKEFNSILKVKYGSDYSTSSYYDKLFDYEFNLIELNNKIDQLNNELNNNDIDKNTFQFNKNNVNHYLVNVNLDNLNYRQIKVMIKKIANYIKKQGNEFQPLFVYQLFELLYIKNTNYNEYLKKLEAYNFFNAFVRTRFYSYDESGQSKVILHNMDQFETSMIANGIIEREKERSFIYLQNFFETTKTNNELHEQIIKHKMNNHIYILKNIWSNIV